MTLSTSKAVDSEAHTLSWPTACSWVFNLRSQKAVLVSECYTLLHDTANRICFQEGNLWPALL